MRPPSGGGSRIAQHEFERGTSELEVFHNVCFMTQHHSCHHVPVKQNKKPTPATAAASSPGG